MLVIDPGTLQLPLRSAGEQCPPLPALYSFCIIPKSNPIPQGIFCLGVMFVQLDLSCRRRRRWRWAVPLVLAALLLALPQLAALRPAALARVDRVVGRHYMTRLDALQQENFTLHQQLAQSADALTENAALRQLVGCGRDITGVTLARVVARGVGGFTLACPDAAPGNAVLDAGGRYAGVVTRTDGDTCTVEFPAAAGLCGSYAGLVTPGQWVLTGLPADCALTAGDIVTTAGGDWLGTLAAAPTPDADGLTAQIPLTDTADLWGTVYFVKK